MWKETGDGVILGNFKKIIIIVQKLLKPQIEALEIGKEALMELDWQDWREEGTRERKTDRQTS